MKHFVYMTTHVNGKFYVGRHSTFNESDNYLGSGVWVNIVKDKSTLTRVILAYANTPEELTYLEQQFIDKHFDDPNCMNLVKSSLGVHKGYKTGKPAWNSNKPGWASPEVSKKISNANLGNQHAKGYKFTSEQLAHRSAINSGENNPNFGKKTPPDRREKMRLSNIQRWTPELRAVARKKALSRPKVKCIYCSTLASPAMLSRWHNENCKTKEQNNE